MGSRNPEKEMLKNHVALETYMKLAEAAIKSSKSNSKKLLDLKTKLEESFLLFNLKKINGINIFGHSKIT